MSLLPNAAKTRTKARGRHSLLCVNSQGKPMDDFATGGKLDDEDWACDGHYGDLGEYGQGCMHLPVR
jgi:hypothetical protein